MCHEEQVDLWGHSLTRHICVPTDDLQSATKDFRTTSSQQNTHPVDPCEEPWSKRAENIQGCHASLTYAARIFAFRSDRISPGSYDDNHARVL
jgi:hypothetical protein